MDFCGDNIYFKAIVKLTANTSGFKFLKVLYFNILIDKTVLFSNIESFNSLLAKPSLQLTTVWIDPEIFLINIHSYHLIEIDVQFAMS